MYQEPCKDKMSWLEYCESVHSSLEKNYSSETNTNVSIIKLPNKLKKELTKYINDCYSSVSFRYVGSLNNERNRTEMCSIFSECIRYFRQKNNLSSHLSDEVRAVPSSNNSVDIVFPDWVISNIDPKYSIQES